MIFLIYCVEGGHQTSRNLNFKVCFNDFFVLFSSSTATVSMIDKALIAFVSYVVIRNLCLLQ